MRLIFQTRITITLYFLPTLDDICIGAKILPNDMIKCNHVSIL